VAEHETSTVAELRHDHERELRELRTEMMTSAQHYKDEVQRLESMNRQEINATNERHLQQLKVLLLLLLLLYHYYHQSTGSSWHLLYSSYLAVVKTVCQIIMQPS